jgi:hypothetical protein
MISDSSCNDGVSRYQDCLSEVSSSHGGECEDYNILVEYCTM